MAGIVGGGDYFVTHELLTLPAFAGRRNEIDYDGKGVFSEICTNDRLIIPSIHSVLRKDSLTRF